MRETGAHGAFRCTAAASGSGEVESSRRGPRGPAEKLTEEEEEEKEEK